VEIAPFLGDGIEQNQAYSRRGLRVCLVNHV
jgi:hypothetical protein